MVTIESLIENANNIWTYINTNILLHYLTLIAVILFALSLITWFVKKIVRGLAERLGLAQPTLEKILNGIVLTYYILALLAIAYVLTGAPEITLALIGLVLVIIAASWNMLSDIISYYVIIFSSSFKEGDYIRIGEGVEGRIEKITRINTILDNGREKYVVPNRKLLGLAVARKGDESNVSLLVKVKWIENPYRLQEEVENELRRLIEESSGTIVASAEYREARIDLIKVSNKEAVYRISLVVPGPKPDIHRLKEIIYLVSAKLYNKNIDYTVEVEL